MHIMDNPVIIMMTLSRILRLKNAQSTLRTKFKKLNALKYDKK
jgi:hypothetical protein